MKIKIPTVVEKDVKWLKMEIAVRYDDEDMPYDFPLRQGDMWNALVDVDTGEIKDFPKDITYNTNMKVCDEGTYTLYDADMNEVAAIVGGYVPNKVIPGSWGDYVRLNIADGKITNWPTNPDLSEFVRGED